MKRAATIATALVTGMLTLGLASQASAMPANGSFILDEGNTPSRLANGVDHYHFRLDDRASVSIRSQGWGPGNAIDGRLSAVLVDDQGNVVANTRGISGIFAIEKRLEPGDYTLEVDGDARLSNNASNNYYRLTTRIN